MLAVSPLGNTKDELKNEMVENFMVGSADCSFGDFISSGSSLLSSIDFDDLFVGINDGDLLPDLEMDPADILAEFSISTGGDETETNASVPAQERVINDDNRRQLQEEEDKASGSCNGSDGSDMINQGEEAVSKRDEESCTKKNASPKEPDHQKGRKSSSQSSKNPQGKRKVKVDWTPELHRRFVQAVEQLGVDKAVPSRILELMGIDFLTRHNIASHLQKYRSHRKHMLAREAEAASWNQKRQMYGSSAATVGSKRDTNPWLAPTIGFPPMTPFHHFRPLHVWGHPPPAWAPAPLPHHNHPPPPPVDASYWHSHHKRVPNALTQGTPCFQPPFAATRFPSPFVPGIPHHVMYNLELQATHGVPSTLTGQTYPHYPPFDHHPTRESIDAAIGDVLTKPWLPLPLGLKPPSLDTVFEELQSQGISKIPPSSSSSSS